MMKDFFGFKSQAFFSPNVSSKSDLTAGYVDSKKTLIFCQLKDF